VQNASFVAYATSPLRPIGRLPDSAVPGPEAESARHPMAWAGCRAQDGGEAVPGGIAVRDVPDTRSTDTCHRCGLRRATRELEQRGIRIRLCDDCYWGADQPAETGQEPPPAA